MTRPTKSIFEISQSPSRLISESVGRIELPRQFGFLPTLGTILAIPRYLNEVFRRIEIEPATRGISTELLVRWRRAAATLGGLAGFQVVFGLAALLYCRGGFEVVDNVSTLSSMFADFPIGLEEEKRQEGAVYEGKFVRKGDKARWVLSTGVEKDIKVT